jgi:hypothetical protein
LGIDLFTDEVMDFEEAMQLVAGKMENTNKPDVFILKHITKALNLPALEEQFSELAEQHRTVLISERQDLLDRLQEQGLTTDLQGIDDIRVVGTDLLTITIVYPTGGDH